MAIYEQRLGDDKYVYMRQLITYYSFFHRSWTAAEMCKGAT